MLVEFYRLLSSNSSFAKRLIWKNWYQLISKKNRLPNFTFMNYGFINGINPTLDKFDESNRVFIQLYDKVLSKVSIQNKKVLEVGSGRGGGANYVAKYLKPKELIGIDISLNAVQLCNNNNQLENLNFKFGDSENIPFSENEFDVVYNIESSHCYGSRKKFTSEVCRVLKNTGYFCWADLCTVNELEEVVQFVKENNFKIIYSENITLNVLKALDEITETKETAINNFVPKIIRSTFKDFAGVKNTRVYNSFNTGQLEYHHLVAQK
ncbi:MAG: methyltransferase domain-containing protein [Bacteroidetes bacterium]|nr:methyltransferase domain-containing protein [Bacteroidota bacterium]